VKIGPVHRRNCPPEKSHSHEPWEICIAGELNDQAGELIDSLVQVPWGSRGIIWFDSGGGSAYAGLAMASVIRLRGLKATGVVAGECSSATLLPFAACCERIVTPLSSLFFHPMRWQSDEDVRIEEAVEWTRHFREMEGDLDRLLSEMFGVPIETIVGWTRPGKFVRGKDLVEAGLAREVKLPGEDLRKQLRV
jgi:ATP-dependent protease ClpP protease subunit